MKFKTINFLIKGGGMIARSCDLTGCSIVFLEVNKFNNKTNNAAETLTRMGIKQTFISTKVTKEIIRRTKRGTFDAVLKLSKHGVIVPHKHLLIYMP